MLLVRICLLYVTMCVHLWNKDHLYKQPKLHKKMLAKMLSLRLDPKTKLSMVLNTTIREFKEPITPTKKNEDGSAKTDGRRKDTWSGFDSWKWSLKLLVIALYTVINTKRRRKVFSKPLSRWSTTKEIFSLLWAPKYLLDLTIILSGQ